LEWRREVCAVDGLTCVWWRWNYRLDIFAAHD
jgi:hypothetical protein